MRHSVRSSQWGSVANRHDRALRKLYISPIMIIRPITSEDFESVAHLIRKTILAVNARDYSPGVIDQMLQNDPYSPQRHASDRSYYVAVENEVILWIIGMRDDEIKTFFVDSQHHGKWTGTLLLRHIEATLAAKWYTKSRVFSSISARSFYEKNGYILILEDFLKTWNEIMLRYYLEKNLVK